ncbi:MAG: tetratricopeptide repeat protein [bacterium]|nr:tetratricopeptide repeat protein [bacterium]
MHRETRRLVLPILLSVMLPLMALASGGSSRTVPGGSATEAPQQSPEAQAIEHYNTGIMMRDRAWKLETKAEKAATDAERAKLEGKVGKQYARALREFESAVSLNPEFHQAYSSLGYAARKTGDYDKSVQAYDRALGLAPDYAEAIEYRAEAHLALGRLDDVKSAYMKLFEIDRKRADELMAAMKTWVGQRGSDPGDVSEAALREFGGWVEQREQIARQTASLSGQSREGW